MPISRSRSEPRKKPSGISIAGFLSDPMIELPGRRRAQEACQRIDHSRAIFGAFAGANPLLSDQLSHLPRSPGVVHAYFQHPCLDRDCLTDRTTLRTVKPRVMAANDLGEVA